MTRQKTQRNECTPSGFETPQISSGLSPVPVLHGPQIKPLPDEVTEINARSGFTKVCVCVLLCVCVCVCLYIQDQIKSQLTQCSLAERPWRVRQLAP